MPFDILGVWLFLLAYVHEMGESLIVLALDEGLGGRHFRLFALPLLGVTHL